MFIDDSLFANTERIVKHRMAISIETLYIILWFPDETIHQNPPSLDKYFQSIYSYERVQLGKRVNPRKMSVGITEKKIFGMITKLSNWYAKRKIFTFLQSLILCGKLEC